MIERASLALWAALACLAAGPAYADCANPAGKEADRIYNSDYHTYQYCNGTKWVPFSGVLVSGGGGGGCSNPAGKEADQIYNGDYHTWQFCNGTAWVKFAGVFAPVGSNIFGNTIPGTVDAGPDSSVNLGVVFKSDVSGVILGIRFYKAPANTGTHKGNLWSIGGTKLAEVTFTGETASGWQAMTFASPVAITAGTYYVASYLCPNGHYAGDQDSAGFQTNGTDNGVLHAIKDGTGGNSNGVFTYGAATAFPSSTFHSTNYYVDVMFT